MQNSELSKKRIGFIIFGLMLSVLLAALDSTIVGTAMPKVIKDLQGMEHYAWPFTAYMLCSTIGIPIFGKLADIYGRKPIFFIGIILFLISSALCGLSQTMTQLIVFRGLQGIGGGILMSSALQVVGEIFPPSERGKYMGLVMSAFGLASIFGPTLGGFITDNLNWRWVFYVNLPVGLLTMIVMFYALPYKKLGEVKRAIDYLGALTLIIALVPMLLAFSWAGKDYAWLSPQILGMLGFSLILLIVFIMVEAKAAEPIIPLSLFRNSIFTTSILAGFFSSALMFSTIVYIPLFVQGVIGSSATSSGMVITPMMLSQVITGILSGQIISRTGKYKLFAWLSFILIFAGMVMLSQLGVETTNSWIVLSMIVTGIGIGITMPVFSISVQNSFPLNQLGVATSGLMFFRNIGGTIGTAVFGSVMISSMTHGLSNIDLSRFPAQLKGLIQNPQKLTNPEAINTIKSQIPPDLLPSFNSLMTQVKTVLASSIHEVFFVGIFIAVAGFITVLFLKEIELKTSSH